MFVLPRGNALSDTRPALNPVKVGVVEVLVIDDAAPVRSRLAALFGDVPGIGSVLQAESAEQARALLESHRPQVVVLDLHLKQENGLSLLQHIKRTRSQATVIVLTNDASEHHRRSCKNLGADYFFDKSTEFEAVLPVLEERARATG